MQHNVPNQMTGAEAAVRMLQHHGVKHIFGLCGDTSLPFYDALARLDHGIKRVLTRDERSAAYMAGRVCPRVRACRCLQMTERRGSDLHPAGGGRGEHVIHRDGLHHV